MTFGRVSGIGLALVVTLGLGGCSGTVEEQGPFNLLLVTIDTLRADHCSAYGYHRETTPFLDQLAAKGAHFQAAYAPMPVTGPTHATLFTSYSPAALGMLRNGITLGDEQPRLATILQQQGYQTAAFVGSYVLSRRFGFAKGFDHFDDNFSATAGTFDPKRWEGKDVDGSFDRRASETTERALAWLEGQNFERPVFLWVHYFDPHRPYLPPPPYDRSFAPAPGASPLELANAAYDGEIRYTDDQLRRLVTAADGALGARRTLLVVTADHGEGLMDHGWPTHGPQLYEEAMRVPLLIRWPGRITAGPIAQLMSLGDILPTVLDLLDIDCPGLRHDGQSLAAQLTGSATESQRAVFMQRKLYHQTRVRRLVAPPSKERVTFDFKGKQTAIRRGRWKYIATPDEARQELYDLLLDPGEQENLVTRRPGLAAELAASLEAWYANQLALAPSSGTEPSPEDLQRLRALGYAP